ncbi:anti-sigma factor [Planctomycetaceae bacterium SH139]
MNDSLPPCPDRLEMLLAESAVGPLQPAEEVELQALLAEFPEVEADEYARAAALFDLAFSSEATEALPTDLQEQILKAAPGYLPAPAASTATASEPQSGNVQVDNVSGAATVEFAAMNGHAPDQVARQPAQIPTTDRKMVRQGGVSPWLAISGWCAALAAGFALAMMWNSSTQPSEFSRQKLVAQREQLLAVPGTILAAWSAGPHPLPTAVSGDVVWNQNAQTGYMTFAGLPANNPSEEQYQLWIIDPERDEHPIDGGVFDVANDAADAATVRTIVPINAKLKTIAPKAFAITIEQPGGVVVSDQSRLPLLAAID